MGIIDIISRMFVINEGTVSRTIEGVSEVAGVAQATRNPYAVVAYLLANPSVVEDITAMVRDEERRSQLNPIMRYLLNYVSASYLIDVLRRVFASEPDDLPQIEAAINEASEAAQSGAISYTYALETYRKYTRAYADIHDRLMRFAASNIRWANRSAIANGGHPGTRFYSNLYLDDMYYRDMSQYTPFYGDRGVERGQITEQNEDHFITTLRSRLTSQTLALSQIVERAGILPESGLNVFMTDDVNDPMLAKTLASARLVFGNALDEGELPIYTPYSVLFAFAKYFFTPKMLGTAELFRVYADIVSSAWAELLGETRFNSWF